MSITVDKKGRRYYLRYTPFSAKDTIKAAGCKWDPKERCWWTGKAEVAEELVTKLTSSGGDCEKQQETVSLTSPVIRGRVSYKGKTYYLLAERKDGTSVKVCFRDGSRIFWTRQGMPFNVLARYQQPKSIQSLKDYAERAKQEKADYGYVPVRGKDYCGYRCPVGGFICSPDQLCHDCQ